jgi:hypothetical protein
VYFRPIVHWGPYTTRHPNRKLKLLDFQHFLENTADGQNTLHGTMLVINQNKDSNSDETAGVVVDEPLCIPDEIVSVDVTTVCRSPTSVEAKPITVDKFNFHSNDHLVRKYEVNDRVWLMASFSHTERSSIVGNATPEELSASPCEQFEAADHPEQRTSQSSTTLEKTDIMPTWAATNSLL